MMNICHSLLNKILHKKDLIYVTKDFCDLALAPYLKLINNCVHLTQDTTMHNA